MMQMPSAELEQVWPWLETMSSGVIFAETHVGELLPPLELVVLHTKIPGNLADEPVRLLTDVKATRRVGSYPFWNQPKRPARPRLLVFRPDRSRPLFGGVTVGR